MKKCSELKYFDMRLIKHQIFDFPEAKARFESLCELECDTSTFYSYFYKLSRFCQHMQRLIIDNTVTKPNDGIVKLIEVQKNLKYFEWLDGFNNEFFPRFSWDPYEKFLLALEAKADSIEHLGLIFKRKGNSNSTLLQKILPKFHKLKTLIIEDKYHFFTEIQLNGSNFYDLEILKIEWNKLNVISSIVENNGGRLKKILFNSNIVIGYENNSSSFNENSLKFIRNIYENCPSIDEYLSIIFSPSKEHFNEFEKLLKVCKNLKSLLLVIKNIYKTESHEKILKNGEELLKVLISSAPINLKEIRFYNDFRFSLEVLEEFLREWRGCALSILISDLFYERKDFKKLFDKYKNNGTIKDFICEPFISRINYYISHHKVYL
ncbi:unnamed protein product [Rhizophagus irregularis]|nr:unnamed protein product [Rhizophagus irregularis]